MYALNHFQLHNEAAFDQQVQFERAGDALAFVLEGDTPLALDTKVFPSQSVPRPRQQWHSCALWEHGARRLFFWRFRRGELRGWRYSPWCGMHGIG